MTAPCSDGRAQTGLGSRIAAILVALALCAAGLFVWALATTSASAAVIANAVNSITVTPTNPSPSDLITANIDFCVPGAKGGDTFTVTLPTQLKAFPSSFPLTTPDGTTVIGEVTVNQSVTPAVATFTMNDYVNTHSNTCGTAFFTSKLSSSTLSGTTQMLKFTTSDDTVFTQVVSVGKSSGVINRKQPRKFGTFVDDGDQCGTTTADCLRWTIETPVGPANSGHITDALQSGQALDCGTVQVRIGVPDASGTFTHPKLYKAATVSCANNTLDVTLGAIPAGELVQVKFEITATGTHGPATRFTNSADVQITNANDVTKSWTKSASVISTSGGGNGVGSTAPPTTTPPMTTPPTTTPPTTTPPTTTPPTTTPPTTTATTGSPSATSTSRSPTGTTIAPSSGVEAASTSRQSTTALATPPAVTTSALPFTGAGNVGAMALGGVGLAAAGAATVLLGRRRSGSHG